MHKCHTMMVRKRMAVSRLRRIAEDGEVVLEDETQGIELGEKSFRKLPSRWMVREDSR